MIVEGGVVNRVAKTGATEAPVPAKGALAGSRGWVIDQRCATVLSR